MRSKFTNIIIGVIIFVLLACCLIWGGTISTIEVTGDFAVEPQLKLSAEKCLKMYIGKSFWLLSDNPLRETVLRCETMFSAATVKHSFPRKLIVVIQQIEPLLKIVTADNNCIVFHSSAQRIILSSDRCILYKLPLFEGTEIETNSFVQDYSANLMSLLNSNSLVTSKIELKGDKTALWYQVTLSSKVIVYLPSGTTTKEKIATLVATLNALNTAKERYSIIDLRFDMITYK